MLLLLGILLLGIEQRTEASSVTLSAKNVTVSEGGAPASFTVKLDSAPGTSLCFTP